MDKNKVEEPQPREKASQDVAANPNPRANENIRTRPEEDQAGINEEPSGSEITDGEDA